MYSPPPGARFTQLRAKKQDPPHYAWCRRWLDTDLESGEDMIAPKSIFFGRLVTYKIWWILS
jgi:hypothetical protein